jgi:hypothetical protein
MAVSPFCPLRLAVCCHGVLDDFSSPFRPAVVAYCGVVGPSPPQVLSSQTPKESFANQKISPLFSCEVLCNQFVTGTSEIVNAVGAILPNVNFTVRVGNFVDDHHKV